jgi:polyisoprenoid-binding protein YceI
MKQALIAALGVFFFSTLAQAATYEFDPSYTEVRFYYDAQGLTIQSGEWGNVTGSAEFDGEDLSTKKVSMTIAADPPVCTRLAFV